MAGQRPGRFRRLMVDRLNLRKGILKHNPRRRELNGILPGAVKQPASQLLLLAAYGGLRHIQPLGRLRKRHAICGWETYSELPTQRFQHQYFDDTNLIKNMVFDLDVPTIGAIPGLGFHWDSAMLCDVTIAADDTVMEVPHAHGGLVPGDGMGLMAQHYFGTKRGNYYMMTTRQFTAQNMLDFGMVSEVVAKDRVMARAWEIARMWKRMPYENRCIMANLAKRPLKKLFVEDLKLHTVSEQYGSLLRIAANEMGDVNAGQQDEKYIARTNYWRYTFPAMQGPMNEDTWNAFRTEPFKWLEEVDAGTAVNPYEYHGKPPYRPDGNK